MKALIAGPLDPAGAERLRASGLELAACPAPEAADPGDLAAAAALLLAEGLPLGEETLRRAPALRLVVRAGAGLAGIDLPAARERGIAVHDTPGAAAIAAAEHAFALLLALERGLAPAGAALRAGQWRPGAPAGRELAGRTLGLLGLGRVGREVAWRGRAFGMDVRWHDPGLELPPAGYEWARPERRLEDLLAAADVLSVHVPLTRATRGRVGARELSLLRADAVLVHVSDWAVLDARALHQALAGGRLRGAALDVRSSAPPGEPGLFARDDVVATPGIAGATVEARRRAALEAAARLLEVLAGR